MFLVAAQEAAHGVHRCQYSPQARVTSTHNHPGDAPNIQETQGQTKPGHPEDHLQPECQSTRTLKTPVTIDP